MRVILLFILLTFGGCQTTVITGESYPQLVSVSSPSFLKAKYFTELTYITKDKTLVREFRKCYVGKNCVSPKFKELRKWAAGKERPIVIQTIDLFLKATFHGQ